MFGLWSFKTMTKSAVATCAFSALVFVAGVAAAQSPGLKAGGWDGQTVTKITGPMASNPMLAPLTKPIHSRKCISPKVADQGPIRFLAGSNCSLSNPKVTTSQIEGEKVCTANGKERVSHVVATFTGDHMSIIETTSMNGSKLEMTSNAEWVGSSCAGFEE
jgi:hypothetical protein